MNAASETRRSLSGEGGPQLGRVGVWSAEVRFAPPDVGAEAIRSLEALGYTTCWFPGGHDNEVLTDIDRLLSATHRMAIGSGILNIWKYEPREIAEWFSNHPAAEQSRIMVGLGVSHASTIGESYSRPLSTMRDFVRDLLDAGMSRQHLCLAALGPKMLELSAELTAGAHPYLATPEHTALARRIMGASALLAPEQGVVLESDPGKARHAARQALELYRHRPNYQNNWLRLGFTENDVADLSDRLIDALFAWGDARAIGGRIQAHFDAGADHVCIQVVSGALGFDPGAHSHAWRALSPGAGGPMSS